MESDNRFAQWAALFLRSHGTGDTAAGATEKPAPALDEARYQGLTEDAGDLLRAVDAGGVPAFVTSKLKQIALDNGIEISAQWTPNQIVDAIRDKAGRFTADQPKPGA